ncbi:5700_t:CDS:2, partial [Funneliformis mosseae]
LLWCENIDDVNRKEWQVCDSIYLHKWSLTDIEMISVNALLTPLGSTLVSNVENNFRMRQRLHSSVEGWKCTRITQVSRPWLICIGDGTNWSD